MSEASAKTKTYFFSSRVSQVFGGVIVGILVICGVAALSARNATWQTSLPSPCVPEMTCIVIASLNSDNNAIQTRHLLSELDRVFYGGLKDNTNVQIQMFPIRLDKHLISDKAAERKTAEAKAVDWLKAQHADILVYGQLASEEKVMQLRLLPAKNSSDKNDGLVNANMRRLDLPLDFSDTQSAVFLGAVQSQGYSILKDYNLSSTSQFMHEQFETLVASMPQGICKETAAEIHLMYALSAFQKAEQTNSLRDLNLAVDNIQKAIELTQNARGTMEWAQKNHYLAIMLETQHKHFLATANKSAQMAVLEQIIQAYRASENLYLGIGDIDRWGSAQIKFSDALLNLGSLKGNVALVDESMAVSQNILSVLTEDKPQHFTNRAAATLWYALALDTKGEFLGDKRLNVMALQILKELHENAPRGVEISVAVTEKLQNLIAHMETQQALPRSL